MQIGLHPLHLLHRRPLARQGARPFLDLPVTSGGAGSPDSAGSADSGYSGYSV